MMNNKYPTIPTHVLSDLCTRFVMNVPDVESQDVIRIFFQVELAHWFYLDFYCQEDSQAKQCTLREFCYIIVNYCPTLSKFREKFDEFYENWKNYKQAVPTYGAILLDPSLQYCLLVQGYWMKSSWSFAKGKVNQDESPISCAIREVLEETSYNIEDKIDPENFIEKRLNEQICRLYIVHGIPLSTTFKAQTRSEIKTISWFDVDLLPVHKKDVVCKGAYQLNPNQFFTAIPFVKDLKIRIQKMKSQLHIHSQQHHYLSPPPHLPPFSISPPFPTTHSYVNVSNLSQKPISKSKTQAEFFESLLKNSAKKTDTNRKSATTTPSKLQQSSPYPPPTPPSFLTPQPPPPTFMPFASYSTPLCTTTNTTQQHQQQQQQQVQQQVQQQATNGIVSTLFSSLKASSNFPDNPKLASHQIKSFQEKSYENQDDESFEKEIMSVFSFEAPAWNTFQIDVESVMAAVFES